MAKFRIDHLSALARQMQFTPLDTRRAQIDAAEELLHDIEPTKAYPLDFVIFRVTEFRPRGNRNESLLTGLALQHDLGLLIEQISETLDLQASAESEPVLTIDDVTAKFNVTSKTIQRWRRRGLPARRFIFADGRSRVGFLLSSVERFLLAHAEQAGNATDKSPNVSQLGDAERGQIISSARRLAKSGHTAAEIARRIGRSLNRSPLAVHHTIRKHDEDFADTAVLSQAAPELCEIDRTRILKASRRGIAIRTLAKKFARPRAAIFRVIVEERIARLNRRKVRFIDDVLYHQPDASSVIETIVANDSLAEPLKLETARVPRDLPPYLADLYRTPLLSPARERSLFLKFNFLKYRFVAARRKLEPQFARRRDLELLERHLQQAVETKNAIVRANLRLVVSIAKKHLRPNLSLMELISDGNLTLMRAVESFDAHRGNRFSTYATLALMKGFARSVPMMLAENNVGGSSKLGRREPLHGDLPDRRSPHASHQLSLRDDVRVLLQQLDPRERQLLSAHFGIVDSRTTRTAEPITHEQLGQRFGLSTQRVRQIERAALQKLRVAATYFNAN